MNIENTFKTNKNFFTISRQLSKTGKRKIKIIRNRGEVLMIILTVAAICATFIAFVIYPVSRAVVESFFEWNPLRGIHNFVGFANYLEVVRDRVFLQSVFNTLLFSAASIFFKVTVGVIIALAIYRISRFKSFFRTIYFMPVISSLVALSFLWLRIYDPNIGLLNDLLAQFSIEPVNWIRNPKTALASIIFMTVWKDVGYAVVIYLAGLMNLSKDVYDSAKMDGASGFQILMKITLPLLKPTTLLVVVHSLIVYLQTFVQPFVITQGGPGTKTYMIAYNVYIEAFRNYRYGYSTAIGILLFLLIILITIIQFKVIGQEGSHGHTA